MDRIALIRPKIDKVIEQIDQVSVKRSAALHIYGVSQLCALLSSHRGLNVELAIIAGLLHDIYRYTAMTGKDHAHQGALMARRIMEDLGCFTPEETEAVTGAIYFHSDKAACHLPLDEVLKDADILQRVLYDPGYEVGTWGEKRMENLCRELGLHL